MREYVISECHRLADELGEYLDSDWSQISNKTLLEIYGDLRIDIELGELYDENEPTD
jgi:hypothetical protein